MSDEDECTWIALEAATKNVVALLCIRKENGALSAPVATAGRLIAAGLELRTATGSAGSAVAGQWPSSATVSRASADLKEDAPAARGCGEEAADALTSGEGNFADGDKLVRRA
jgi:hypothetical protein